MINKKAYDMWDSLTLEHKQIARYMLRNECLRTSAQIKLFELYKIAAKEAGISFNKYQKQISYDEFVDEYFIDKFGDCFAD